MKKWTKLLLFFATGSLCVGCSAGYMTTAAGYVDIKNLASENKKEMKEEEPKINEPPVAKVNNAVAEVKAVEEANTLSMEENTPKDKEPYNLPTWATKYQSARKLRN